MAKMGKFSAGDFKKFQTQLNKIQGKNREAFLEGCAKELAARLLAKVIERTPVGDYPKSTGKKGGTLQRGWTIGEISKDGTAYKIDVSNLVEYASYVEFGHRTPNHNGWVPGHFMLTISEQELEDITPKVLEAKIAKYLRGLG